jgi:hypothetical protein
MKSTGIILIVALLGAGGIYLGIKRNEARILSAEAEKAKREAKVAEAKKAEAENNRKAKDAEARKAEAVAKTAEEERLAAADKLEQAKVEKQSLEEKRKLTEAENIKLKLSKDQSIAKDEENKSEKARLEIEAAAAEKKLELEKTIAKRVADERAKAEAELAAKESAERIASAALKKSENDLKVAKLNRETERDRRFQMYKRGEVSKAEMIELEKAEKALAREESIKNGILPLDSPYRNAEVQFEEVLPPVQEQEPESVFTNEVSAIVEEVQKPSFADLQLERLNERIEKDLENSRARIRAGYEQSLREMIAKAEKEGREADAKRYKRALWSLISDPMDVNPDSGKKFK